MDEIREFKFSSTNWTAAMDVLTAAFGIIVIAHSHGSPSERSSARKKLATRRLISGKADL